MSVVESLEGSLITCLLNVHANTYIKHPSKIRLKNGILPMEQTVVRSVILSNCCEGLYHPTDWTWSMCCLPLSLCKELHLAEE